MQHRIVSPEAWREARVALLAKEKAMTRARDELAREQRALPWMKVEKDYVFQGPDGALTFADLFRGKSQLFLNNFMKGPGRTDQCVGCSLGADHVDGILEHLEAHDVAYVSVSRAPIEEIEAVRKRMGWRFPWVSSYGSDFNYDFEVSYTPEQLEQGTAIYNFREIKTTMQDLSGDHVFFKDDDGQIYRTYSTYSRGGEEFLTIYRVLDLLPKGREENGPDHSMTDWVRLRGTYGQETRPAANGSYPLDACGCAPETAA